MLRIQFCKDLNSFAVAIEALDKANEGTDIDAFNKAYKQADKAWNKLEKSAAKLENIEINQSVKSYHKLEDKINKIESDGTSIYPTGEINAHIDSTFDEIADILTTACN